MLPHEFFVLQDAIWLAKSGYPAAINAIWKRFDFLIPLRAVPLALAMIEAVFADCSKRSSIRLFALFTTASKPSLFEVVHDRWFGIQVGLDRSFEVLFARRPSLKVDGRVRPEVQNAAAVRTKLMIAILVAHVPCRPASFTRDLNFVRPSGNFIIVPHRFLNRRMKKSLSEFLAKRSSGRRQNGRPVLPALKSVRRPRQGRKPAWGPVSDWHLLDT